MIKKVVIKFRVSRGEADRIKNLAAMYADGNLSVWCRYATLEANRIFLTKGDRNENSDNSDNTASSHRHRGKG